MSDALDISQYLAHLGRAYEFEPKPVVLEAEPVPWNLPLKHWSPSSLSMFQRCPRQWQERYIHGRKERPAESPFVGTAVHHAVEVNFRQKIDSHSDIPLPQLLDYYGDTFPILVEQEQESRGGEILWDTSPDRARERGKKMLAGYQNQVAERIQPTAVELKIAVDLGLGVPVEGRFDTEREESVIDLKSGRSAVKKPKEAWRIQGLVYGEARNKPVEFHSVSATKTGAVTVLTPLESEPLLVQLSQAERRHQVRTLRALSDYACYLMASLGPDEPWPTMGVFHSWACSYCGYRGDCPAWSTT